MDDLRDFAVGGVFGSERFAGQAVDVGDVVVFEALVEDFGADEAGGACEEDSHGGCLDGGCDVWYKAGKLVLKVGWLMKAHGKLLELLLVHQRLPIYTCTSNPQHDET